MTESKVGSIIGLTVGVILFCAWCLFWRYVNLAINQALQDWLCESPGCFKVFEILRFMVIWGYNFIFVFAAIAFITGVFGIISGRKPEWMKKTLPEKRKNKKENKKEEKKEKEGYLN